MKCTEELANKTCFWRPKTRRDDAIAFPETIGIGVSSYTFLSRLSRVFLSNARRQRALKPTQTRARHRSSDEREGEKNNDAPVYCSTSDFTHPLSPSSNVSKNAAPSNFCCSFPFAWEREDPVVTNATVATVAIVFNPPIVFIRRRVCAAFDR